jgi:hypothetical protein
LVLLESLSPTERAVFCSASSSSSTIRRSQASSTSRRRTAGADARVRCDIEGPAATIILTRPDRRNAQTPGDLGGAAHHRGGASRRRPRRCRSRRGTCVPPTPPGAPRRPRRSQLPARTGSRYAPGRGTRVRNTRPPSNGTNNKNPSRESRSGLRRPPTPDRRLLWTARRLPHAASAIPAARQRPRSSGSVVGPSYRRRRGAEAARRCRGRSPGPPPGLRPAADAGSNATVLAR